MQRVGNWLDEIERPVPPSPVVGISGEVSDEISRAERMYDDAHDRYWQARDVESRARKNSTNGSGVIVDKDAVAAVERAQNQLDAADEMRSAAYDRREGSSRLLRDFNDLVYVATPDPDPKSTRPD